MLYSFHSPPTYPPPPLQYDTLSHRKMSAASQEEEKNRREAVVTLLLLKISLVKFSLSQRLAAQTRGLQGVNSCTEAERERQKGKERGGGWRSRNAENEQIAQAKLA